MAVYILGRLPNRCQRCHENKAPLSVRSGRLRGVRTVVVDLRRERKRGRERWREGGREGGKESAV